MFVLAVGVGFVVVALALRFAPDRLAGSPATLGAVALLAGAGALEAAAAPTGWWLLDGAYRVAVAVVLVGAGACAGRVAPFAATVLLTGALFVAGTPVVVLAGAALGVAAAGLFARSRSPLLGAVVGGLACQVVLRLEWAAFTGASLLVGLAVAAILVLPALWHLPPRAHRPLGWTVAVATVVALVGAGGAAVAALGVVDDVELAVADAERGLDLLGDDADEAHAALDAAAARFASAEDRLGAPWVRPALAVPVLSQQVRAVTTMAGAGRDLAEVASATLSEADLDRVRPVGGRIDLDALRELRGPLDRADAALRRTDERLVANRSPWLVAPVADRLAELGDRVEEASTSAELASEVVEVLPAMLGGDGPRRYLLLVQQPAEARGSGGLPGNYGEILADDGRLELVEFGRYGDLQEAGTPEDERTVDMPGSFDALYGYDDRLIEWANVTFAPDFTVVAELVRQLYPQSGGQPIDGVISLDPTAVADLLDVLGGVELSDGRTLHAGNAEEFLYFEQYVAYEDAELGTFEGYSQRVDLLGEAAARTWGRITEGDLPGPRALASAFSPAIEGRHLQMAAFDPGAHQLLERLGLSGSLPEPSSDGVGFVVQNVGENKVDWFLDRTSAYDVRWDPATASAEGTYRVTLGNRAPAAGLPRYIIGPKVSTDEQFPTEAGDNAALVYLYTALPPVGVRVDVGLEAQGDVHRDGRWYVTPLRLRIPAETAATIEVDVAGQLLDPDRWRLDVVRQPSIHGDALDVHLTVADGWALRELDGLRRDGGGRASASVVLDAPVALSAGAVTGSDALVASAP